MSRKKAIVSLVILFILLLGGGGVFVLRSSRGAVKACRVVALNVGQGDAILIRTPDNQDVLIDGGPDDAVLEALDRNLPLGDDDIELMVSTHTDGDHLNGLVAVMEKYKVKAVLSSGAVVETKKFKRWQELIAQKKPKTYISQRGQNISLGTDLVLQVLWPDKVRTGQEAKSSVEVNNWGVVLRATCAGSTALFMADVDMEAEGYLVESGESLRATLLKIGHHGSRYSTSADLLKAVQPTWAIISVGENKFGHPHPVTLNRLDVFKIKVLRTDKLGDVKLKSDGSGNWLPENTGIKLDG